MYILTKNMYEEHPVTKSRHTGAGNITVCLIFGGFYKLNHQCLSSLETNGLLKKQRKMKLHSEMSKLCLHLKKCLSVYLLESAVEPRIISLFTAGIIDSESGGTLRRNQEYNNRIRQNVLILNDCIAF